MRKLLAIAVAATLALPGVAAAQNMVKLKAGMVTGIDQVGLPIALSIVACIALTTVPMVWALRPAFRSA